MTFDNPRPSATVNPPSLAASVLLVADRAAMDRVSQTILGLSTLERSTLMLRRLGNASVILCLPDAECERACSQTLREVAEIVVGPQAAAAKLAERGAIESAQGILLDAELVVTPEAVKAMASERWAGLACFSLSEILKRLSQTKDIEDLVRSLSQNYGRWFEFGQKQPIARLNAPKGRQQAIALLNQNARGTTDSFLGGLNRTFSLPLSRLFIKIGLSPNAVSYLALGFALLGGLAFRGGSYFGFLVGALLNYFSCVLDASDGEVARLTYQESPFGCWLDSTCDYLSYFFTFGGLFWGTARAGILPGMASLISILLGMVLSVVVFVGLRLMISRGGATPDMMSARLRGAMREMSGDPVIRMAKLLAKLPTRGDLGYIIIGFALLGEMKAFLVFIAFAAHLVWILALYVGFKAYRQGYFQTEAAEAPESQSKLDLSPASTREANASKGI